MYKVLAVLSLALLSCYALTDEEIALFYNDGCGGGSVTVERDGDNILLATNGVPDHKWQLCNPNSVVGQEVEAVIPNNPVMTEFPFCLAEGPIGWATNGVAIYHPFAGGELNAVDGGAQETFDVCDGHPTPTNEYHYHRLPMSCIYVDGTQTEQFIGVARDGFAIYGPYQADLGRDATNADLDECHGRYSGESYRYVFLARGEENYPYVMGCYRAEPAIATGGPPAQIESCETCTSGQSPCYGVGEVCTCIRRDGAVELLSYAETTEEGDGVITECTDDAASATCRDPHDTTPDDLDLEVLKILHPESLDLEIPKTHSNKNENNIDSEVPKSSSKKTPGGLDLEVLKALH